MKYNLPVIVLNDLLLFPYMDIKLEFDDEISKKIVYESEVFQDNKILVVTNISNKNNYEVGDLPRIGTLSQIVNKIELPNGKIRITLKGISRCNVLDYLVAYDSLESLISTIDNEVIDDNTNNFFIKKINNEIEKYVNKVPYASNEILSLINNTNNLSKIVDIIVNYMPFEKERKIIYLFEVSLSKRVEMILTDIYKEEQLFNIEKNIDTKVQKELDEDQKNFYLKEKIKLLKDELGENSTKEEEIINLKNKVEMLNANEEVKSKLFYEINRYENMSIMSPEVSMVKNYIDLMLELPWNNISEDTFDFSKIIDNLNKTHYGLLDIKERIVEYLAVCKNSVNVQAPIICLVGPPGVGKTSIASSIASSIGRSFVKISVGGINDEAFIKGHIRTYLGSSYGKIIDGIRRAKTSNPVFLIDEIDKMSFDYGKDPRNALLDVLDSSQNKHFKDNYLEEEYDLSKVFFITTANSIDNIPRELLDRLEIINISGYTELDKLKITKDYIIKNICLNYGIKELKISDEDILNIIRYYTHEQGLRNLERCISKIIRKIITEKEKSGKKINLNIKNIEKYLGSRIYEYSNISNEIGVVNALSSTINGGEIIKIETTHYKGEGNLIVTGILGQELEESVAVALSYIKANYKLFNIDYELFKNDIHINIPNMLLKKDGPSAGVSITTSIISDLTNLKIDSNIAFTGEITLRGNILKVGNIKEKILGASINNINKIFIPYDNIKDIEKIPKEILNNIEIIPVKKYEEIYDYLKEK